MGGQPVGVQRGGAQAPTVLLARVGADLGGLQAPHVTPGSGLVQLCGRLLVAGRGETGSRENRLLQPRVQRPRLVNGHNYGNMALTEISVEIPHHLHQNQNRGYWF